MNCCIPTIVTFAAAVTVINYSPVMVAHYGVNPNVQVYYKDGSEFVLSDDLNVVKFDGVNITADHGGINTGFIKIF